MKGPEHRKWDVVAGNLLKPSKQINYRGGRPKDIAAYRQE